MSSISTLLRYSAGWSDNPKGLNHLPTFNTYTEVQDYYPEVLATVDEDLAAERIEGINGEGNGADFILVDWELRKIYH